MAEPPSLAIVKISCCFFLSDFGTIICRASFESPADSPGKTREVSSGTETRQDCEENKGQIYVGNLSIMDLRSRYGDLEVFFVFLFVCFFVYLVWRGAISLFREGFSIFVILSGLRRG